MNQIPLVQQVLVLTELIASGQFLDGLKIRLYKNDTTPNDASVLADFTTADYSGYADSDVIEWGGPYLLGSNVVVTAPTEQFQPTGSGTANLIYGYVVYFDGSPDVLRWGVRLPLPVSMDSALSSLFVAPTFGLKSSI